MKRWLDFFVAAARSWQADNAFKHSAAVSFYTLFSLAPITIIAVTVAGSFFGKEVAAKALEKQVAGLVGPASAEAVRAAAKASENEATGVISTTIGVALLLIGATTVFGQLQDSLNQIWDVQSKTDMSSWAKLVIQRLISFAMVLTIGFLLLVSLILTTALTSMLAHWSGEGSGAAGLLKAADIGIGLVTITVLFALLFKVLPDAQVRWRDVWLGAAITAALFTVGRHLIALYLGHSTVASIYGTAGSLVALLIWVYYSCAILFYGAELTRVFGAADHRKIKPKTIARVVKPRQRARAATT